MKVFPLFLLWITLPLMAGCLRTTEHHETDPDLGYKTTYTVKSSTGLREGPYTKTDSLGLLLETGFMKDGKQEGMRELYYPDGKVKVRERYKAGALTDLYEYFYPEGPVELKGYYVDGAMYGLWRKFSKEGQLMEEVTMINNEEMGPFHEYHANGRIQAEGTYLHGPNEHGRLRLYDENGQLQKEMLCNKGRCYTLWEKQL